ncbi:MAG: hypothetical protein IT446_01135 [Phycisphaerales bacterium]|nr:hypothetical protein [Phycisphaerales bacterium]
MATQQLPAAGVSSSQTYGISQVADPPPAINGDIDRLGRLPGWIEINGSEHVSYGHTRWKGDSDLSGDVLLAWDLRFLYVAARVRDDVVAQKRSGTAMWEGDHVMLILDVPRQQGIRNKSKVFQIGLSPGDLRTGTDPLAPEIFQWFPHAGVIEGARIGAKKTPEGYNVEAAIPWKALGIENPQRGLAVGFDICLSDADSMVDPQQSKVMSLLTAPWDLRNPDRQVEGFLAGGDGKVDPAWLPRPVEMIQEEIRIKSQSSVKVDPGQKDASAARELLVRARIDNPSVIGGNWQLQVNVNGTALDVNRIRNRLARIDIGVNQLASSANGSIWFLFYAPNFKPIAESTGYAPAGVDPYELRFDITDLWKAQGGNTIELVNTSTVPQPIIAEVGVSTSLSPKLEEPKLRPAPTGEIPTIVPITEATPDYSFRQLPGGGIEVKLGNQHWVIESAFSTTTPGWAVLQAKPVESEWTAFKVDGTNLTAATHEFELQRAITRHDDHLQVVDRITNTSNDDLPVMFHHQTIVDRASGKIYICGLPAAQAKMDSSTGAYPVSLVVWDKTGLALVGEDDLTRAQGSNFVQDNTIGVRDDKLVVAKGKTVEIEFSIYPLDSGDPFALINRIRRNWDVNFTIPYGGTDTGVGPAMNLDMSDQQLRDSMRNRNAHYAISTLWIGEYAGQYTEFLPVDQEKLKLMTRMKQAYPEVLRLAYFHCYAAYQAEAHRTPQAVKALKDYYQKDLILRPDGTAADYGAPSWPLFLPTIGSRIAEDQEKIAFYRLEKTGYEGTFWDEIEYSAYKYDYNPEHWDGVSGDIDRDTHRLVRKVTNVTLASQPWRLQFAEKLMKRGPLVGNWAPSTRTFTRVHFPRFVETGVYTHIISSQLYTPIALGDNLTERNEIDCYKSMVRGLDYGALYFWYSYNIPCTHPTLMTYMYPITPINLGHGYIIGQERILTNRSGYFGWGDNSDFEILIFDQRGAKTEEIKVPKVDRAGQRLAEIRIPEGYSVVLIRK